eukprot:scaffold64535_cov116-Phaeocystis_antarctica.AAC.1
MEISSHDRVNPSRGASRGHPELRISEGEAVNRACRGHALGRHALLAPRALGETCVDFHFLPERGARNGSDASQRA